MVAEVDWLAKAVTSKLSHLTRLAAPHALGCLPLKTRHCANSLLPMCRSQSGMRQRLFVQMVMSCGCPILDLRLSEAPRAAGLLSFIFGNSH